MLHSSHTTEKESMLDNLIVDGFLVSKEQIAFTRHLNEYYKNKANKEEGNGQKKDVRTKRIQRRDKQ